MKIVFFFLLYLPFIIYLIFFFFNDRFLKLIYLIQFFFFFILILIYLIFYIFYNFCIFFYKTYRYNKYYYSTFRSSKFFFNKLSIYFSFWRYLIFFIWKQSTICVNYLLKNFFNILKRSRYLSKIYLLYFYLWSFIILFSRLKIFLLVFYKLILFIYKHLYNIFQIDEFYLVVFSFFKSKREDPFFNRNNYFKLPFFIYEFYPFWLILKYKINIIHLSFSHYFLIFCIFFINFFFNLISHQVYLYSFFCFLLKKIYIFLYNILNIYLKLFFLLIYFGCYYLILYFIYSLIFILINFFNLIFLFFFKIKNIILCLLFLYFCLKYFWIINYYFYFLYQHYILYFPLTFPKSTIRSFDFVWIDFRNYINLIGLHNSLIDLSYYNNEIYNKILIDLNVNLKNYGLKFIEKCGLSTFNLHSIWKIYNNDTFLLDKLLKGYNKIKKKIQLKGYRRLWEIYSQKVNYTYNLNKYLRHLYKKNNKEWVLPKKRKIVVAMEESLNTTKDSTFFETDKLDIVYPLSIDMKVRLTFYMRYYLGFLRKRLSSSFVRYPVSTLSRLNHIPLHYIILQHKFNSFEFFYKYWSYTNSLLCQFEINQYLWIIFLLRKYYKISMWYMYNYNNYSNVKFFFFKSFYFYNNELNTIKKNTSSWFISFLHTFLNGSNTVYYKIYPNDWNETLLVKYNIPSYNWTETKYKRLTNSDLYLDIIGVNLLDEEYNHEFYEDMPILYNGYKWYYRFKFIYIKYPYKLYNKFQNVKLLKSSLKIYNNNYELLSKILKKYYFFKFHRVSTCNYYYTRLLEDNMIQITVLFTKLQMWNSPFFLHYYNLIDFKNKSFINILNFWDFFYYVNCNKYYFYKYSNIYKNKIYINLKFIQRYRKDLYHVRQLFLRLMSIFIYFKHYNLVGTNLTTPLYENLNVDETTTTMSLKNILSMDQWEEPFDDHYTFLYHFNLSLIIERVIQEYSTNLLFYLKIFFHNYSYYFKYPIFFNNYNFIYQRKVYFYKSQTLRKITNLKRFLFLKNKKLLGFSIFNYFKCFSVLYHINHLLWHSPYSFLLFKINNIINTSLYSKKKILEYYYKNIFITFINYSFLFNLLLNSFDIYENWAYELTVFSNVLYLEDNNYYYYNYGHHNYLNLNSLDCYRIFISLIFKYYNSFLEKLSRYSYIIRFKHYQIKTFFLHYFNFKRWFKYFYIRYRFQIYRFKFWGEWIKRAKLFIFKPKNYYKWRSCKNEFLPWWLFYEKYIKVFIYCLLKYYYNKFNFMYWWFWYRLNFYWLIFIYIKILELIFIYKFFIQKFFVSFDLFKILFFNFYDIEFKFYLYKWINLVFKFYFSIWNFVYILDFKYFIYYKMMFIKLIKYYISLFFNLRNKNLLFKSNYYYYRKHKGEKLYKKRYYVKYTRNIAISSFKNIKLRHSWNSLRHYTKNFFFFKNLYRFNFINYIYIYNTFELHNISNSLFYYFWFPLISFKYKIFNLTILWFLFYFIIIFLYLYIQKSYLKILKNINNKNLNKYLNNLNIYFKNIKTYKICFFNLVQNNTIFNLYKKNYYQIGELSDLTESSLLNLFKNKFNLQLYKKYYIYILFNLKQQNKQYSFYSINLLNAQNFNFWIIYLVIMIPLFFFEYILWKLHIKGHIMKRRRFYMSIRLFLDNFKFIIKFNRFLGSRNVYTKRKIKAPRNYYNYNFIRRKKRIRSGYFFKQDRFKKLYCHLSSMGSYYYWFAHIEKFKYYSFFINYFFNSSLNSIYYWIFLWFYLIFIGLILVSKSFKFYRPLKSISLRNLKNIINWLN